IWTPAAAAPSKYCSMRNDGSTTTATPASASPTRYEAHPRSSSTNCRKSSTAAEVNSRGRRSQPDVQGDEQGSQRQSCADHRNDQRRLAELARPVVAWPVRDAANREAREL